MIKVGQPFDLTLRIPNDLEDFSNVSSAAIAYRKPDGTEGTLPGCTLDRENQTVQKVVSADTNDQNGAWRFISVVTMNDGSTYDGEVYMLNIYSKFQTES